MTLAKSVGPTDVVRSDRRGRLLVRARQRALILEAFDASALSGMAFCRQHGLSYSTFANWIQKRRKDGAIPSIVHDAAREKPLFAEVIIPQAPVSPKPPPALKVSLPCGTSFEISDVAQVPLAIQLLQSLPASRPC